MPRSRSSMRWVILLVGLAAILALPSCATVPESTSERRELVDEAHEQLGAMKVRNPDLESVLDDAAGYAVFPNVGKGGFLFGGAFGRGAVYRGHGDAAEFVGYAKVTQASVGGVVGGRLSAMLLVFEHDDDLKRFTAGDDITFGAEATAIAIETGTSAAPQYANGVAVYILPRGGLMADASISGQQFAFEKRDADRPADATPHAKADGGDAADWD